MYPYMNEDVAFERVKDMQREMENSRQWAGRTIDVLGLFARPIIALVEMAILTFRPLPVPTRIATADDEPEPWQRIAS
jgi:hypothetical protein